VTSRRRPSRPVAADALDLFAGGGAIVPAREPGEAFPARQETAAGVGEPHRDSVYDETGPGFPGASVESAVGVGALTQTAKDLLEGALFPLWVRGEVTDFKRHRNGHWYFCLRDAEAQVRCVVWSRDTRGIPASPDEGMQVAAFGQLSVYAARGEMQFIVRRMEAAGDGLWRKALEATVARLTADGLLAPERKRPIPRYPRQIAVITSASGAAFHDVVAVMKRRAPGVRVVLVPAAVQGPLATRELVDALGMVARWGQADALIFGRGGGGREDLWAFNDESVARALAACPIPTISAVGHEIDMSVCDLVADWRAPTPSAAAEIAVRSYDEATNDLRRAAARLSGAMEGRMDEARARLGHGGRSLVTHGARVVDRRRSRMQLLAGRLDALSPLATLARGYAVARTADGRAVASVGQLPPDTPFELLLRDGRVRATSNTTEAGAPASFLTSGSGP
jgi:exodeoxyribonuclease VII large subunit